MESRIIYVKFSDEQQKELINSLNNDLEFETIIDKQKKFREPIKESECFILSDEEFALLNDLNTSTFHFKMTINEVRSSTILSHCKTLQDVETLGIDCSSYDTTQGDALCLWEKKMGCYYLFEFSLNHFSSNALK